MVLYIFAIVLIVVVFFPYFANIFILPGDKDSRSTLFEGEWFHKIEYLIENHQLSADSYRKYNRYAHYFGHHGCEPETFSCPYRGFNGQWKLMFHFLTEDKKKMNEDIEVLKKPIY